MPRCRLTGSRTCLQLDLICPRCVRSPSRSPRYFYTPLSAFPANATLVLLASTASLLRSQKKKKKTASLHPEGQSYPPSATASDRRRSPAVVRAWRTCGHRVAASEMVLRRRQRPAAAAAGGLLGPWLLVAVLVYSSFLGSTVFLAVDAARTSAFVAVAPLPMAPSPSPTAAELVGDSKRKVPTGANPLHNR